MRKYLKVYDRVNRFWKYLGKKLEFKIKKMSFFSMLWINIVLEENNLMGFIFYNKIKFIIDG